MHVSRRNFLVAAQTLIAATTLPMKILGATLLDSPDGDLHAATTATFQPLVNSSFALRGSAHTNTWLTLLSVKDLSKSTSVTLGPYTRKTPNTVVDTFALNFQGIGDKLEQGTYELEHRSLGKFSLFLVPSGVDIYTAVISHVYSPTPISIPKPTRPKN